jgi:hypothetical protein
MSTRCFGSAQMIPDEQVPGGSKRSWAPCQRRHYVWSSMVLVVFWLLYPVGPLHPSPREEVGLPDDAYHYHLFADGQHDANYLEWWYFNVFDVRQDLQAIVTYVISDPANLSGRGTAQVVAVAYTPQGTVSAVDVYAPDRFVASEEQADVQIDANAIQVLDAETYRIMGGSRDGRLRWDLRFQQQARSWFAFDRLGVGTLPWEQMSWLVYMPGARVSGQVTVDGQVYAMDAQGYHDHNWGEWIFTDALWNWAQHVEPDLAFAMADFIRQPLGRVSVLWQGERTVFTEEQYRLWHTRWAFDVANSHWYPLQTILQAENDGWLLLVQGQTLKTHALRGTLPWPLPDVLLYEQTAQYTGHLFQKTAGGHLVLRAVLSGHGFKEYTATSRLPSP